MAADPYRAFNFALLIEGVASAEFVECTGVGAHDDVIAYREGGANQIVRHLPGDIRYTPITLRYGVARATDVWDWIDSGLTDTPLRRNISIIMYADGGALEAFRLNLFNAWVSSWRAGSRDARANEVAIDAMTVVYDRLERD